MTRDAGLSVHVLQRADEASTLRAIRHATLNMVATCDEETLAAVVELLTERGLDAYSAATELIVSETPVTRR